MQSNYIRQSDYNKPKFKILDSQGEEIKTPQNIKYVALLQYKDQERRAVILRTLPESKNHLKYLLLEIIEKEQMPEETQLGEIFKVDESAIDTIEKWVNWQCGINEVYKVAIDGLVNRKTSFHHVYGK